MNELKTSPDPLLLVDGGRLLSQKDRQPAAVVDGTYQALTKMGYQGAGMASVDLAAGWQNIEHAARLSEVPLITTNLQLADGGAFFPRYRLVNVGEKTVALLAVTDDPANEFFPSFPTPQQTEGLVFQEPVMAVKDTLAAMDKDGVTADLVVLISQCFDDVNTELLELDGLDLIVARKHTGSKATLKQKFTKAKLITTMPKAEGVTVAKIKVNDGRVEVLDEIRTRLDAEVEENKEIAKLVERVVDAQRKEYDEEAREAYSKVLEASPEEFMKQH